MDARLLSPLFHELASAQTNAAGKLLYIFISMCSPSTFMERGLGGEA